MQQNAQEHSNSAAAIIAACMFLVGCSEVEIPEPPDMTSVVKGFDAASADLPSEDLAAVVRIASEQSALLERLDGLRDVIDIARTAVSRENVESLSTEQEEQRDSSILASALKGEVAGNAQVVCRGWVGASKPDPKLNGRANLQFTATERGLSRVVWGSFDRCRMPVKRTGVNVELNGDFAIYLARAHGFRIGTEFIVQMDCEVGIDGEQSVNVSLDFRAIAGESLEIRFKWDDGYLLYTTSPAQNQQVLQGRDDVWQCDLEAKQCTSRRSESTVSW